MHTAGIWIGYRRESSEIRPHTKFSVPHALLLELSVEKSDSVEHCTLQKCIAGIKNIRIMKVAFFGGKTMPDDRIRHSCGDGRIEVIQAFHVIFDPVRFDP